MKSALKDILSELRPYHTGLVAVSKLQSEESILELYKEGQRDFGENYVQECITKYNSLPKDIRWHFIGHLQTNKVKLILPFIHLIHGIDRLKLLEEINRQSIKINRTISVLLQIHIADETSKFGFSYAEVTKLFQSGEFSRHKNIRIEGFMGMATNTPDTNQIRKEFKELRSFYDKVKNEFPEQTKDFAHVSMGMTSDFHIALEEGSTLVRIGSALFGERKPKTK